MLLSLLGPVVSGLFSVIDKAVEDKDEASKIKARLQEMVLQGQMKEIEAAAQIIVAEAKGDSWLQRSWRPMLMCLFGLIIANNYILAPYAALFGAPALTLDLPPDMWDLLKIGVGGYVVGRSVEKGVSVWKGNGNG
ncbi:MAG: 3TM-type holin [Magnetovibrionaceae bacterium]